ncbi:protein ZNRD2 isoform X2 [Clupea harengus]|uniref:Protein ZNRD2 isoform X2 n=1 Tax=Clupea harengus TaxID=7950 RepID=A0A6P8F8K2_CLUHA|nr:protein ZNRD2 isoform X2 [Clupea harengus]
MALNGDDDFEWEPPSEAEMKVLEAQRERQDKISKLMGSYLLKGYKMLGDCCQHCATILLEDRQKNLYCVACQELDSDVDKDDPALNAQAALSQVRERQLACQPPLQANGEAPLCPSNAAPRPIRTVPRPEHCEGAAAGLRAPAGATSGWSPTPSNAPAPRPSPAPLDPASVSPGAAAAAPVRPPAPAPVVGVMQQTLGEAEQALLGKLQWAACQLEQSPSVEASVQLCQLIHSCATSLRSIRDLERD